MAAGVTRDEDKVLLCVSPPCTWICVQSLRGGRGNTMQLADIITTIIISHTRRNISPAHSEMPLLSRAAVIFCTFLSSSATWSRNLPIASPSISSSSGPSEEPYLSCWLPLPEEGIYTALGICLSLLAMVLREGSTGAEAGVCLKMEGCSYLMVVIRRHSACGQACRGSPNRHIFLWLL